MLSHVLVTLSNTQSTILTIPADQEADYASSISVSVQNVGNGYAYVGGSDVSDTSYGFKLEKGQVFTADLEPSDDIYGFGDTQVAIIRITK